MEVTWRDTVRIVCLDASARVLLLKWQDPHNGALLWEPPGGGIEPGETPYQAACRELIEETSLDSSTIVDKPVMVPRDLVWNGRRYVGSEPFYPARFPVQRPAIGNTHLLPDETANLRDVAWFGRDELARLVAAGERLEPASLPQVIASLDPGWL